MSVRLQIQGPFCIKIELKPEKLLTVPITEPLSMELNLPDAFWSLTAADLLERLQTSREGLSEVEARRRLDRFGRNTLKARKHAGVLTLLLSQYKSPIILILVFACLFSFALRDHADALIILAILLVSGLLGFWQERGPPTPWPNCWPSSRSRPRCAARGAPQEIPLEEIVPGDVVLLNAGDVIPGDCLHPGVQGPVCGRSRPHRRDLSGGERRRASWPPDVPLANGPTPCSWGPTWSAAPPRRWWS